MPDAQGPSTLRIAVPAGARPAGGAKRAAQALATAIVAGAIFVASPAAHAGSDGRSEVAVVDSTASSSFLLEVAHALENARGDVTVPRKKGASGENPTVRLQALQDYIGSKYQVNTNGLRSVIETAWAVGGSMKLDPLLLLAVMAIESSFDPRAESGKGAQGLMQVMTRIHRDKFEPYGGTKAAWHPEANINVGAQILRDCIERRGSVPGGLTCYVGSPGTASAYGRRVLAERDRLRAALLPEPAAAMVADAAPQAPAAAVAASRGAAAAATQVAAGAPAPRPTTLSQAAHDGDISNEPTEITASLTERELSAM
ncbi:lytic transglycosylase domain-containing protein [Verticiella sediminum]